MHGFAALLMSGLVAATVPAQQSFVDHAGVTASAVGEVYVAELDADWNVAREVRVPCSIDAGCAVDLGLTQAGLASVHVRFDAMRAGKIAVSSRVEDLTGHAAAQPDLSLALDRSGFGAAHYEPNAVQVGTDGKNIIMMAVRVPGWSAPLGGGAGAQRT
jgi:hypothetical protein